MKHLLLFAGLGLACLSQPTMALGQAPAADTLLGHAHLVRQLSQELCTKITNDHTTAFGSLTPPQAMELTQRLFVQAMQRDSVAVLAMMSEATKRNLAPAQVGQLLGRDVVVQLSHECPASLPLLARLSQTEQAQQAMAARQPAAISDTEKKTLQPIATRLCTQLAAADAKKPLSKMQPAQRQTLFTSLMQKELLASQPALRHYYSPAQLADPTRQEEIGYKVAMLMLAQPSCGTYMLLLGADELARKKP